MPYNLNIPGEMTEVELRAIEAIASHVPEGGAIVEVGSYFGLSSWTWAKSVHPSVTVYCIDPWEKYRQPNPSDRYEILEYGEAAFRHYTADCPNIVPLRGYSPRDFKDWDIPIDLYFEDAVHQNPLLAENLAFWTSHLKKNGIICGHDFLPAFPDVIREISGLAGRFRRTILTARSLWCLVPVTLPRTREPHPLAKTFHDLDRRHRYRIDLPQTAFQVIQGQTISISGSATNESDESWPVGAATANPLRVGARLHYQGSAGNVRSPKEARFFVQEDQWVPGQCVPFTLEFSPFGLRPGLYTVSIDLLYENLYWFSSRNATPTIATLEIKPKHTLSSAVVEDLAPGDERFWRRYVPEWNPDTPFGIDYDVVRTFRVRAGEAEHAIPSMLTIFELANLYAMARHAYKGNGAVIDLGPLFGVTTAALAQGLADNAATFPRERSLFVYDLFYDELAKSSLRMSGESETGSMFELFQKYTRAWSQMIVPAPGDLNGMRWRGGPVGLLHVDIAKTWDLNRKVVRMFFPHLIPGESYVIQQDYVHYYEYWLAITMEFFSEHFELVDTLSSASAVFRCVKKIPAAKCMLDLYQLPLEYKIYYFDAAIEKATQNIRPVMQIARARCLLDHGRITEAEKALDAVSAAPAEDDLSRDFSDIRSANLAALRAEIVLKKRSQA